MTELPSILAILVLIYIVLTLCLPIFVYQIRGELKILNRQVRQLIELQAPDEHRIRRPSDRAVSGG